MDYGLIAIKIVESVNALEEEKNKLSSIEVANNWSGLTSEKFVENLKNLIANITEMKEKIKSFGEALRYVELCKSEDSKIRSLEAYRKSLNYDSDTSDVYTIQKYQSTSRDINASKNSKNSYLISAKGNLSSISPISTSAHIIIPVIPNYDYSDLTSVVAEALKGYKNNTQTASMSMSIASSVGVASILPFSGAKISDLNTFSQATGDNSGSFDSNDNYTYSEEIALSGGGITSASFYAPYVNGKSYSISEEALKDPKFNKMMAAASNCKNVKYSLGANASPSNGYMDCSGFVSYVLNNSGYSFERTNCVGLKSKCKSVSASELQPGDLVFFKNTYKSGTSHVGIYIGDGKMIHCNKGNSHSGVNIQSLSTNYWQQHFDGYGRME